jgi:hypothetical protein
MRSGHLHRPTVLLAIVGITVGLAACGSSDAGGTPTVAPAPAITSPATTVAVATTAPVTTVTTVPASAPATVAPATAPAPLATDSPTTTVLGITDAEVADLEKQLDDIDQLLAGVGSDLKQD